MEGVCEQNEAIALTAAHHVEQMVILAKADELVPVDDINARSKCKSALDGSIALGDVIQRRRAACNFDFVEPRAATACKRITPEAATVLRCKTVKNVASR
jgi:hypothetical protein